MEHYSPEEQHAKALARNTTMPMRWRLRILLRCSGVELALKTMLAFGCVCFSYGSYAAEFHLAVAAGFKPAMEPIAKAYQAKSGDKLVISYGAVGMLYAQIKQGAPFDILLSADSKIPQKLERDGLGVVGSRFTYAYSELVLWSTNPDLVDKDGAVLKSGKFAHLALPAPKVAVHGAAAVDLMKKMGVWTSLQSKIVEGDNILQALQFVETGGAELGFVSRSMIYHAGKYRSGSYWLVPSQLEPPLPQQAILLTNSQSSVAAKNFLNYLKSDEAEGFMRDAGYQQ